MHIFSCYFCAYLPSLPAWGVWIEICPASGWSGAARRRSPHGECGLKSSLLEGFAGLSSSLPAWGVWIEIVVIPWKRVWGTRRSPHGECGLKSQPQHAGTVSGLSLPAWGVWIEICACVLAALACPVAPRMGSVD